ncbi:MAG: hypothetical protein JJE25_09910 [Bacteroidia bacterium]|nr:hypothetical protein [Bacteroidia bacterium]
MLSSRRRIILITISVLIGSVLAFLLILTRKGTLTANEWGTLAINFFFALAIVLAIGIFLNKK